MANHTDEHTRKIRTGVNLSPTLVSRTNLEKLLTRLFLRAFSFIYDTDNNNLFLSGSNFNNDGKIYPIQSLNMALSDENFNILFDEDYGVLFDF